VIRSSANSATRQFAERGKNKFSGMDAEVAEDLLAGFHAATSLDDLSPLKSVGLHKLTGSRKGYGR
jgi:proteic killer suppression protein